MYALIKNFIADQSGATSIEYAVIATGISVVIVTVVDGLGLKTNSSFAAVASVLQ
jgi:pilus assembly protein Flp/PilA